MPYEGEFASYRVLQRLSEAERVKQLLRRAQVHVPSAGASSDARAVPHELTGPVPALPEFVVAIDGSNQEVPVKNGYPGAMVGYLSVASVLLDLKEIDRLSESRPVDPQLMRKTEEASTVDAALPGSNVVTRTHTDAQTAFREEFYEVLHNELVDAQDGTPLLETYEALLALKPTSREQRCPYAYLGCDKDTPIGAGLTTCPCDKRRTLWSTDALRIHEGFRDIGPNGELFGEVMQVWERVLLVHLLRAFERRQLLARVDRLAFILDGPLAVFGHPAWLSAAISRELKRLNTIAREKSGSDLLIIGVEKTGAFVDHFEHLDKEESGDARFSDRSYFMPTDAYIKKRIVFSDSPKRYGVDTYFGRKFFYKTSGGARIVASIPYLTDAQDTLANDDIALYSTFEPACGILDKLVSCRFPNAVSPLVSAHAHAAIPLHLGAKVLEQLARALMRTK